MSSIHGAEQVPLWEKGDTLGAREGVLYHAGAREAVCCTLNGVGDDGWDEIAQALKAWLAAPPTIMIRHTETHRFPNGQTHHRERVVLIWDQRSREGATMKCLNKLDMLLERRSHGGIARDSRKWKSER